MKILELLFAALTVPAGIFLALYGENDDSPGAFFLGVIVVTFGIFHVIKYIKN